MGVSIDSLVADDTDSLRIFKIVGVRDIGGIGGDIAPLLKGLGFSIGVSNLIAKDSRLAPSVADYHKLRSFSPNLLGIPELTRSLREVGAVVEANLLGGIDSDFSYGNRRGGFGARRTF